MNIFEFFQYLGSNLWLYGGTFVLILSLLVFIHEWGHYIIARLCGVRVEMFSIGFGKELFGFNDKNGTRWKLSLVPLGGYVKLFGDVDPASAQHSDSVEDKASGQQRPLTPAERETTFFAKPVWKRAAIVFAGPAINYIFAILVLSVLFVVSGEPVTPPSAAAVIGGSSAEKHGFLPHDEIVSINEKTVTNFEDIRREMMIGLDSKKHFVVRRDGQLVDIYASPDKVEQEDRFGFKHSRGLLGLISPRHAIDIETIRTVEGDAYKDVEGVRRALTRRMGSTIKIEVARGDESDTLIIRPLSEFNAALGDPENPEHNYLYIAATDANVMVNYTPGVAVAKALSETWEVTRGTLEALGQMVAGTRSASELGGVIRIGALAGDMAQQGAVALILFTALLSINLGLINLFPIPLLDGGHLVFYAFEALLGRPVPDRIQEYAFRVGLAFLVGIMVFANLNDIMQLIL
jgi:regulator of sigma E protease